MDTGMKATGVQAITMIITTKIITAITLTKMVGDMAMETSASGSAFKLCLHDFHWAQDEPFLIFPDDKGRSNIFEYLHSLHSMV